VQLACLPIAGLRERAFSDGRRRKERERAKELAISQDFILALNLWK